MPINKDQFCSRLRAHIAAEFKTKKAAALAWGFSAQYISNVCNGVKPATKELAEKIGYKPVKEIVYTYEKTGDNA